jgi:sphingomyelin phosphodiesterase acid-like 3
MRKYLLGLIFLLIAPSSYAANFIAFSDIHFNPFYSCTKNTIPCPLIVKLTANDATQWQTILQQDDVKHASAYGSDTNYLLLQNALQALKAEDRQYKPKFVVILGDFLGHDYQENYQLYSGDNTQIGYQNFVRKTFQFLTIQLNQVFPTVPVYSTVGNNDSYGGDYVVVPQGDFFKDIAVVWKPLLKNKQNEQAFAASFPQAGYYAVTLPGMRNTRIIMLDSVLFSSLASSKSLEQAANQELIWLQTQLQIAVNKKQKVWLMMHVPVGIDVYKTAVVPFHVINNFWSPAYANKFLQLLNQYSPVITGVLTSHTHMDGFVLLGNKHQMLDSFVPSISPVVGNNPAFKVYEYDPKTFQLQNFKTYFLVLDKQQNSWQQEYSFNQVYQANCKNCRLINGMQKITKVGALATAYQQYFTASHSNAQPISKGKWLPYYWCGIWNVTEQDYKACLGAAAVTG